MNDIFFKEVLIRSEPINLMSMRLVSKEFRENVDENCKLYLEPIDLFLKINWESNIHTYTKIDLDIKKIEEDVNKIKTNISLAKESIDVINLKLNTGQSLFEYLTSYFNKNSESEKQSEILKLQQEKLNQELDLKSFEKELAELDTQKKILDKPYQVITKKLNNLKIQILVKEELKIADNKMKDLFGGRKEYEKLPELHIGHRQGRTGHIDFIGHVELSAPIMRGRDYNGRDFFVVKVDDLCKTYFRRHAHDATWTSSGSSSLPGTGYIIENGKVNETEYNEIKKLIENPDKYFEDIEFSDSEEINEIKMFIENDESESDEITQ